MAARDSLEEKLPAEKKYMYTSFLWGCGKEVGGEPERKRLDEKETEERGDRERGGAIFSGRRERKLLEEKQRAVPPRAW